jgi:hypothetical protein
LYACPKAKVRRYFLQGPRVAVGIAEGSVLNAHWEFDDFAHFHTSGSERFTRGVDVRNDQMQPLERSCVTSEISCIPVPRTIEQADPGGVS